MKPPRRISLVAAFVVALVELTTACADRGSDLAVVYRGDVASYRTLVQVRIDTGTRARVVTPQFPSLAHPEPIGPRGSLPIAVFVLGVADDTVARYSLPSLQLAPGTSYSVGITIGRRPAAEQCARTWHASEIARPTGRAIAAGPAAESLFVGVVARERGSEAPRCDD